MLSTLITKLFFYQNYPFIHYFFGLLALFSILINYRFFFKSGLGLCFLLPFFFMAISILSYTTFNEILLDVNNRNSLEFVLDIFLNALVWFFLGISLFDFNFNYKRIFLPLFVSAFLFFLVLINKGDEFIIDYYTLRNNIQDISITHLHFGDYYIFLIILSFMVAAPKIRVLVFFIGLFSLFGVGGRSNFYIFILTILIIGIFYFKDLFFKYIKQMIFLFLLIFFIIVNLNLDHLGRMAVSKDAINDDESYVARIEFTNFAISKLVDNILFGNPNQLIEKYGFINSYSHNLLSAWQFFGSGAFFSIAFLLLLSFVLILSKIFKDSSYLYNERNMLGFFLLIYVLLSVLLTKSVTFMFLWLVLGYVMCQISFVNKKVVDL